LYRLRFTQTKNKTSYTTKHITPTNTNIASASSSNPNTTHTTNGFISMITTTIPKDSLLKRIESDSITRSFFKTIKSELKNVSLSEYREDLHERLIELVAGNLNNRAYGIISHQRDQLENQDLAWQDIKVYVGESETDVVELALNYLLMVPQEVNYLLNYYIKGADEYSIKNDIIESLKSIPVNKTPYEDLVDLPAFSWVSTSNSSLYVKSAIPFSEDNESFEMKSGYRFSADEVKVGGVLVVNFEKMNGREWEVSKDHFERYLGTRNPIAVHLVSEPNHESTFSLSRLYAKDMSDLKEKIEFIQLGLGESLGFEFDISVDRNYSFKSEISSGFNLELSRMGEAMDVGIKTLLYSRSKEVASKKIRVTSKKKNAQTPFYGRVKKANGEYYRITYISGGEPEWVSSRKNTKKEVDSRYYSSHYRRVWVLKGYLDTHEVPEAQILDHDMAKGRKNKYGEDIYKERFRVAIKVEGSDPVLTIKRLK